MAIEYSRGKTSLPKRSTPTEFDLQQNLETQLSNLSARNAAVENPFDGRGPVEKMFNLQPGGFLQNLGEFVNRPVQSSMQAIAAAAQGQDVGEAALSGITGESYMEGVEFQKEIGWISERQLRGMGGGERFARSLATEIVLDPLNLIDYVPFELLGKGWRRLTTVEKTVAAGYIDDGVKVVGDTLTPLIDELTETLKTQINPKYNRPYTQIEAYNLARKQYGVLDVADITKFKRKAANRVRTFERTFGTYEDLSKLDDPIDLIKAKGKSGQFAKDVETFSYLEMRHHLERFAQESGRNIDEIIPMLMGGSQNTFEDLGLFAKYVDSSGREWYVPLSFTDARLTEDILKGRQITGAIDVKSSLDKSAGAFGATATVKASQVDGIVQFADGVQLSQTTQKGLQQAFDGVVLSDGTPLWKAVTDMVEGNYGGKGISLATEVNPQDMEKIRDAFKFVLKEKFDYLKIIAKDGTQNFVKIDDVIDYLNINGRFGRTSSGGTKQYRLIVEIGLDHAHGVKNAAGKYTVNFKPAWDDYIANAVSRLPQAGQPKTIRYGLLTYLAMGDSPLAKTADRILRLKNGFLRSVQWNQGLGRKLSDDLMRIDGSTRQIIMNKNNRLQALGEMALQQSDLADDALSELVELGGRYVVDEVTGTTRIEIPETTPRVQDYLDKVVPAAKNGELYPILAYQNTTARNVIDNLNQMYYSAFQVEDAFELVQRGDSYFIKLNKSTLSYDDFVKFQKSQLLGDQTVNMGRKQLSKEIEDYLLRPEAQELAEEYVDLINDIFRDFDEAMGVGNIPEYFNGVKGYLRHRINDSALDFIRKNAPLTRSKYSIEGVDLLKDRTLIGTKQDINKYMRDWYGLEVDFFDPGIDASMRELLEVAMVRQNSSEVLKTILEASDEMGRSVFEVVDNTRRASLGPDYTYIKSFKEEFGNMYKNLSPEAQRVLDAHLAAKGFNTGDKAIALHKTVYNQLKQMSKAYTEIPEMLRLYDSFLNKFKGVTLFRPSFHIGNWLGNTSNMYLAGMGIFDQGIYVPRSVTWLSNFDNYIARFDELKLLNPGLSEAEIFKLMPKNEGVALERLLNYYRDGISMKNVGVQDLQGIKRSLERSTKKRFSQKVLEANFNLAESADEIQRFALYNWALDKNTSKLARGGQFTEDVLKLKVRSNAANTVKETLFDYGRYTKFEQDVLKRIFPFYTFTKNNLIFQMKNIFRNPKRYNRLLSAYKYYVQDIVGLDEQDMPEYARDNMWLPIPVNVRKNDEDVVTFMRTNMPIGEFAEFIDQPFQRGVSMVAAPIKIPIELAFNRNVFTGAEIKEFEGQTSRMAEGTGVLENLRNEQGTLALSGDPVVQKIASELGLRVPLGYVSIALDMADSAAGYQSYPDAFFDALENLGVTSMRSVEDINITNLYQLLEEERDKRYRWEQATGQNLPTKAELGLP